ncbi:MAG: RIP metalloprotease RseP [Parcubacteria group bacterium CG23_combo_of_CG06-09_8_20_14_all_35_9]|nr:MAG: RIP metalloprotease RseP [Parcubacteria group bacterium CG23_combo_of_CG06-09_8_20_14_all_35_9]
MLLTIIAGITVLSFLVIVHELGHFIISKKMGVKVREFGVGYPPRIFGVRFSPRFQFFWGKDPSEGKGGTIYSTNWIPFGGFNGIKGESGEDREDKDSFVHKKIWQRAVILFGGIGMNWIMAAVLIIIGFFIGLPQMVEGIIPSHAQVKDLKIQIISILKDSPAEKVGLKLGDIILNIDGEEFTQIKNLQDYVAQKIDVPMEVKLKRGPEIIIKEVAPQKLEEMERGGMGVGLIQTGVIRWPWYTCIWLGLKTTLYLTKEMGVGLYGLVKNLIIGEKISADLVGPVGIVALAGEMAHIGFIYLLQFTAIISLALAITNLLPFPAIDGGRLLFLAVEGVRGRPLNQNTENIIHNVGFLLLILLAVLVTFKDISRLGGGKILEFVQKR